MFFDVWYYSFIMFRLHYGRFMMKNGGYSFHDVYIGYLRESQSGMMDPVYFLGVEFSGIGIIINQVFFSALFSTFSTRSMDHYNPSRTPLTCAHLLAETSTRFLSSSFPTDRPPFFSMLKIFVFRGAL
jgi:hypothetical protein